MGANRMSTVLSIRFGSTLAVMALVAACATSKATYRSNYDKAADFSTYHTYDFVNDPGTNRAGYSTLLTKQFEDAIRREMDSRGYRHADSDPDLLVNFNANAQERVDIQSTPAPMAPAGGYYGYRGGFYSPWPAYSMGGGSEIDTVRYKVGTANIDVADARKKALLWEGVAEGKLTQEVMANPEAAINAVVTKLFAEFPARAQ
jgi:hypothetical protein